MPVCRWSDWTWITTPRGACGCASCSSRQALWKHVINTEEVTEKDGDQKALCSLTRTKAFLDHPPRQLTGPAGHGEGCVGRATRSVFQANRLARRVSAEARDEFAEEGGGGADDQVRGTRQGTAGKSR